jgi:hypothetical protein
MLLKSAHDQTDENYLVVRVQHEGNPVLAGLREAYWRHWEGHYIPEFRVTIRETKENNLHHPKNAHDLCPVLLLDVRIVVFFVTAAPCEKLNPSRRSQ